MFQSKILSFAFPKNYADHENFDLEFEGDDELKFHGKMYDIVSRETSADTIYVKCISDESEDQLREEAGRQIDLNGGSSAHEHSFKIKFNPGVYDDNPGAEWNSLTTSASKIFFHFEISPPLFRYSNVPSPPPWHRI